MDKEKTGGLRHFLCNSRTSWLWKMLASENICTFAKKKIYRIQHKYTIVKQPPNLIYHNAPSIKTGNNICAQQDSTNLMIIDNTMSCVLLLLSASVLCTYFPVIRKLVRFSIVPTPPAQESQVHTI